MNENIKSNYQKLNREMLIKAFEENGSAVCSPLSLYALLSLVLKASNNETEKEVLNVLCTDGTKEDVEEFVKELCLNKNLKLANALCVNDRYEKYIKDDFKKEITDKYSADIFNSGEDAVKKINEWVSDKTNKMIPHFIDSLPGSFVLSLMNAISFNDKWENKYEKHDSYDDVFHCFRNKKEVTYLSSNEREYVEDQYYKGFIKNYKNNRYSLMCLLPKKKGKAALRKALDILDIENLYLNREHIKTDVMMPEFKCETSMQLKDLCMKSGINTLFTNADLTNMIENIEVYADEIIQKSVIEVDRKGTRAASSTGMFVITGAIIPEIMKTVYLDRPFIYAIIDRENGGLPVFTGVYAG